MVSEKGVIIVSKLSTDFPIVLQCNEKFGFVAYIGDDILSLRHKITYSALDLKRMVLYSGEANNALRWVLVIPAHGNNLTPEPYANMFNVKDLGQHKKFSEDDFPSRFHTWHNLAIITGFPE